MIIFQEHSDVYELSLTISMNEHNTIKYVARAIGGKPKVKIEIVYLQKSTVVDKVKDVCRFMCNRSYGDEYDYQLAHMSKKEEELSTDELMALLTIRSKLETWVSKINYTELCKRNLVPTIEYL